jgi:ethanolamine utilization protein EutA
MNKPHTLSDHLEGMDGVHAHDEGSDHDHDHDDFGAPDPETDALWQQDHLTLLSVGIDIGSAGTQAIFSRVHMRRLSEELTSRYFVVGREAIYQSPVSLTPYQSEERIDERAVREIIDAAYTAAAQTNSPPISAITSAIAWAFSRRSASPVRITAPVSTWSGWMPAAV